MSPHEVTLEKCELDKSGRFHECTIEIWTKPWENFEQIKISKLENIDTPAEYRA